jgi:hypothetical protein
MYKLILAMIIGIIATSCASNMERDPLICEKNCKQACLINNKDYKGFDNNIGCFCSDK